MLEIAGLVRTAPPWLVRCGLPPSAFSGPVAPVVSNPDAPLWAWSLGLTTKPSMPGPSPSPSVLAGRFGTAQRSRVDGWETVLLAILRLIWATPVGRGRQSAAVQESCRCE